MNMTFNKFLKIMNKFGWKDTIYCDDSIFLTNPNSYIRVYIDITDTEDIKYTLLWNNGERIGVLTSNRPISEVEYDPTTEKLTRPNTKYINFFNIDRCLDLDGLLEAPVSYGEIIDDPEKAVIGKRYVFSNNINEIANTPEQCKVSNLLDIKINNNVYFKSEESECGLDNFGQPFVCSYYKYIREVIKNDI